MKTPFRLVLPALLAGIATVHVTGALPGTGWQGAAAAGKAAPGAQQEEPPKMEGQEVSRGERGFMGVEIKDGRFVVHFYDDQKKPMQPDVARIALRWDPKYKLGMERVVLNPGPENTMTAERFIRPPYNFKLFMVLVKDAAETDDPVGETYVIDFRQ